MNTLLFEEDCVHKLSQDTALLYWEHYMKTVIAEHSSLSKQDCFMILLLADSGFHNIIYFQNDALSITPCIKAVTNQSDERGRSWFLTFQL